MPPMLWILRFGWMRSWLRVLCMSVISNVMLFWNTATMFYAGILVNMLTIAAILTAWLPAMVLRLLLGILPPEKS